MKIREVAVQEAPVEDLIALSARWEEENCTRGYRKSGPEDFAGRRVFLAEETGRIVGYLVGKTATAEKDTSVMPAGTVCFELEELYVIPERRSRGIGAALYRFAENALRGEATFIMLTTATKNSKAILHFYLEELDMQFWYARLFREIPEKEGSE